MQQTSSKEFLAMAEKAEKAAQKSRDSALKDEWLKIADDYRRLAAKAPR